MMLGDRIMDVAFTVDDCQTVYKVHKETTCTCPVLQCNSR